MTSTDLSNNPLVRQFFEPVEFIPMSRDQMIRNLNRAFGLDFIARGDLTFQAKKGFRVISVHVDLHHMKISDFNYGYYRIDFRKPYTRMFTQHDGFGMSVDATGEYRMPNRLFRKLFHNDLTPDDLMPLMLRDGTLVGSNIPDFFRSYVTDFIGGSKADDVKWFEGDDVQQRFERIALSRGFVPIFDEDGNWFVI